MSSELLPPREVAEECCVTANAIIGNARSPTKGMEEKERVMEKLRALAENDRR